MSGGKRPLDLDELVEYAAELADKLVIAEGKKDGMALKSLGVKNIILLNGRPLAELALHVSKSRIATVGGKGKKEVVILTDFDSEGKRLAARLAYLLKKHKVMVNSRLRRRFMRFGRTRIEDLNDILREGDIHGKVSSNINKVRDKRIHKGQRVS